MTVSYATLLDTIEEESERILATAEQGLQWPVRTCPGWNLDDLIVHVANVLHRGAVQIESGNEAERVLAEPLPAEGLHDCSRSRAKSC